MQICRTTTFSMVKNTNSHVYLKRTVKSGKQTIIFNFYLLCLLSFAMTVMHPFAFCRAKMYATFVRKIITAKVILLTEKNTDMLADRAPTSRF